MISTNSSDFNLELVQVLFRHGDRTPEKSESYPNDPYKSFDYAPFGHAQLTNVGKRRAYKLGETLKNRYGKFIGWYKPDTVYAYSTWLERCKASLMLVLAGLFPPTAELTWNENLPWIPIPFEYNSYDKEMFYSHSRNPRHAGLMKEAYQSPEIKAKTNKFEKTLDYLVEKTGCQRKFEVMSSIFQNIQSQLEFGLPMPDWCNKDLLENLKEAHQIRFDVFSHTNELRKLFMGPFLKRVTKSIKENNDKENDKKIYLYSAHDLTVHAFLRAQNINDIGEITYSSAVILEKLRGKDDKQYVRLLFWPGEGDQFETLKLNGCDEMCPLEKYLEMIDPLITND